MPTVQAGEPGRLEPTPELRRSPRYSVSAVAEVWFDTAAAALAARIQNIGRRGLFAQSARVAPVGTPIRLTIVVQRPFAHLEVTGVVIRAQEPEGEQPGGMGVEVTSSSLVWDRFYDFLRGHGSVEAAGQASGLGQ